MDSASENETAAQSVVGDRRRLGIVVLVVAVGLASLAHPTYLWPHHGQTAVSPYLEPGDDAADAAVGIEILPPATREAVRAAIEDGTVRLWTGEDDPLRETVDDATFVRHEGEVHQVLLASDHGGAFPSVLLRWLLTSAGAFLVVYGACVPYAGSWRPLTPRPLLLVPATVTAAFATPHGTTSCSRAQRRRRVC